MASPASPSELSMQRPVSDDDPRIEYYGQEESKENVGQVAHGKPIPSLSMPPSGRIHGPPMSPVKVNVQSEEWPPQPSSARIESVDLPLRQLGMDEEDYQKRRQLPDNSHRPRLQQSPHRQSKLHVTQNLHQSQAAVISMEGESSESLQNDGSPTQPILSYTPAAMESEESPAEPFQIVAPLEYHHQKHSSQDSAVRPSQATEADLSKGHANSTPGVLSIQDVHRASTPALQYNRHSMMPRPQSSYSDFGARGRRSPGNIRESSPGYADLRASSAQSRRSPDIRGRPASYMDLLNSSYPQPAPAPIAADNSYLRTVVGANASLLSTQKTLEMYRLNVKKTDDPSIQYAFALFLIGAAQEASLHEADSPAPTQRSSPKPRRDRDSPYIEDAPSSSQELLREARHILSKLADRSYPFAQYYLADGYASGLFSKGKEDYDRAFPLFVAASKHGHAESGYRAALCYEFGWGCRKDSAKAVQFYRQSASKNHPGAMTRLGRACLSGDLGVNKYREGLKWLKRATESADSQYNAAPYHLGLLYETGYGDDLFQDETYAAQLLTQAADLGHVEASYRLGDAYEHGKLSCPKDPALSVHWYTGAAQAGHPAAMMALCAWYMIGAEPVLEKDENEAYEWARKAAENGLAKAQYAVGYFTEMGIGCRRDPLEANMWYVRAAEAGDERAKHRLGAIQKAIRGGNPMDVAEPKSKDLLPAEAKNKIKKDLGKGDQPKTPGADGKERKDDKECLVM
ncbi:MAG: hypothetical protein M1818_008147 [Claussenomyces sp. TS43310]|nr:MAG: hypothetical protein M1818_008147 [Claussenomyces sp. TS43310]